MNITLMYIGANYLYMCASGNLRKAEMRKWVQITKDCACKFCKFVVWPKIMHGIGFYMHNLWPNHKLTKFQPKAEKFSQPFSQSHTKLKGTRCDFLLLGIQTTRSSELCLPLNN